MSNLNDGREEKKNTQATNKDNFHLRIPIYYWFPKKGLSHKNH